ncbi:MAG: hypothetical protein J0L84_09850 [Verrucomicrobia bacterium]|nr:hypothetical protein [Verrucomicrobiota bacterium]
MVATALVNLDIDAGKSAVRSLDAAGFPVSGAFWLHFPEAEDWRLVLVTPQVNKTGTLKTYERIQEILQDPNQEPSVPLTAITVMSPDEPLVQALRQSIKAEGLAGLRFSRGSAGNFYIDDAYIYRMT